jgi:hypothetical protein
MQGDMQCSPPRSYILLKLREAGDALVHFEIGGVVGMEFFNLVLGLS